MSQGQATVSKDTVAQNLGDEFASQTIEVPLLPVVAAEVLSSSLDDHSTTSRLAELIQQDQGLASHLLRIVNSPAFRGRSEIVALQQAIARLGMDRIREIALLVSLQGTFFTAGRFEYLVAEAWQHGLRCALWAKEIARLARKNVEIAYLCGLLHNIGAALVINRVCQLDENLSETDIRALVADFAQQAGLLLVQQWQLPSAVGLCIRFQDNFEEASDAKDAVAVVNAASYLAQQHAAGVLDAELTLKHDAMQHLNFYPDDVETLFEHAQAIETSVLGMS